MDNLADPAPHPGLVVEQIGLQPTLGSRFVRENGVTDRLHNRFVIIAEKLYQRGLLTPAERCPGTFGALLVHWIFDQ